MRSDEFLDFIANNVVSSSKYVECMEDKACLLNAFKLVFNKTNLKEFNIRKQSKHIYSNKFFLIRANNVKFIGSCPDYMRNLIKSIITKEEYLFEPVTAKDYALIHDTHNSALETEHSFFVMRDHRPVDESCHLFLATKNKKIITKKYLFIIENQKIFEIPDIIDYFKQFSFNDFDIEDEVSEIDFLFGSGNKITTNKMNDSIINNYEKVFYFGDYDDDGYKIYKNFHKKYPHSEFILPKQGIISEVQKLMNEKNITKKRNLLNTKNKDYKIKNKELLLLLQKDCPIFEMQQEAFLR